MGSFPAGLRADGSTSPGPGKPSKIVYFQPDPVMLAPLEGR